MRVAAAVWLSLTLIGAGCELGSSAHHRAPEDPFSLVEPQGSTDDKSDGRPSLGYAPVGFLVMGSRACTATLLRPDVALTAAHCVSHMAALPTSAVTRLCLGAREAPLQCEKVERVFVHPDYAGEPDEKYVQPNDVALVRLAAPLRQVRLASLAPLGESALRELESGTCAFRYVGYGRPSAGSTSTGRKSLVMCLTDATPPYIDAEGEAATTCAGDSGGPLVVDGTVTVVGVLSGGVCKSGGRSVFIPIAEVMPFIRKTLAEQASAEVNSGS